MHIENSLLIDQIFTDVLMCELYYFSINRNYLPEHDNKKSLHVS
jgi:hypothetical protein